MTGDAVPAEMLVPRFLGGGEIGFVSKPVPEPGRGQLLIGVEANALCGSETGPVRQARGRIAGRVQTRRRAACTRPHGSQGTRTRLRGHRIVRDRRTRNHRLTRRPHDEFRGVQHGRRQFLPACSQHYRHSRASGNPLQQALVLILHLATSAPAHAGPPCPPSCLALHSRATGGRRWGS